MPLRLIELHRRPACDRYPEHNVATYELSHSNETTTLRHNLEVAWMPWGPDFRFTLSDFEVKTFEEGRVRLADWFERLAEALRNPGKIDDKLPNYSGQETP